VLQRVISYAPIGSGSRSALRILQLGIASVEISIALAAQRSGSARATSSGPAALPHPWQADYPSLFFCLFILQTHACTSHQTSRSVRSEKKLERCQAEGTGSNGGSEEKKVELKESSHAC
jgi:hypothetical protein